MGCPKCGKHWLKVEGNRLICSCGYKETVKMPDDADYIEQCEQKLWDIIFEMHKKGVRFEAIHSILEEMVKTLEIQGHCENWLEQYKT